MTKNYFLPDLQDIEDDFAAAIAHDKGKILMDYLDFELQADCPLLVNIGENRLLVEPYTGSDGSIKNMSELEAHLARSGVRFDSLNGLDFSLNMGREVVRYVIRPTRRRFEYVSNLSRLSDQSLALESIVSTLSCDDNRPPIVMLGRSLEVFPHEGSKLNIVELSNPFQRKIVKKGIISLNYQGIDIDIHRSNPKEKFNYLGVLSSDGSVKPDNSLMIENALKALPMEITSDDGAEMDVIYKRYPNPMVIVSPSEGSSLSVSDIPAADSSIIMLSGSKNDVYRFALDGLEYVIFTKPSNMRVAWDSNYASGLF